MTRCKGSVLIVTIWILLILVAIVLVFALSVRTESLAAANSVSKMAAELAADGAVSYVFARVGSDDADLLSADKPYEKVAVGDAYFWVLRANLQDDRKLDYGLADEAGKINLNTATREMLLRLPGMTSELACSIIDWRDGDSEVTPGGAESEYYLLLDDSYNAKNSRLETIEELMMIRGCTKEILYGEDANLNGILDDSENDAAQSDPADNSNGRLDRGIYDYVTVYSSQSNTAADGSRRININSMNMGQLGNLIRQTVGDDKYFAVMDSIRAGRPFANIIDFYYKSSLAYEDFEKIADRLTTSDADSLDGLVNINAASKEVLMCLPALEESDVDKLIAARGGSSIETTTIAWVTKVLDQEKAVEIGGHITTQSFQFSADIISASADGRAYARRRIVIDTQHDRPRILFVRDISDVGWPLEAETIEELRSGNGK